MRWRWRPKREIFKSASSRRENDRPRIDHSVNFSLSLALTFSTAATQATAPSTSRSLPQFTMRAASLTTPLRSGGSATSSAVARRSFAPQALFSRKTAVVEAPPSKSVKGRKG